MTAPTLRSDWLLVTRAVLGDHAATRLCPDTDAWLDVVLQARALLESKARSFALASLFLPADVRDDLSLLYGFCRLADDLADTGSDRPQARAAVERLRDEVEGRATARPIISAFRALANRAGIPLLCAGVLLDGVASDLGCVRIEDDDELIRYCYRVAGTVGLMLCPLLGVRGSRALPHAIDLGIAMQLSNIVRDVVEDAALDRVYLPRTRLARAGLTPEMVVSGRVSSSAVRNVSLGLVRLAETYYRSAEQGMRDIPARNRLGILAASRLYRAIGLRACAGGRSPLQGRAVVSAAEKTVRLGGAVAAWLDPRMAGIGRSRSHARHLHQALADLPGAHQ